MGVIFTSLYYQGQLLILLLVFYQSIAFVFSCLHFIYMLSFYHYVCSSICGLALPVMSVLCSEPPKHVALPSSHGRSFSFPLKRIGFFLQSKEVPAPAVSVHPLFSPKRYQAVPKISFIVFTQKSLISVFHIKGH